MNVRRLFVASCLSLLTTSMVFVSSSPVIRERPEASVSSKLFRSSGATGARSALARSTSAISHSKPRVPRADLPNSICTQSS